MSRSQDTVIDDDEETCPLCIEEFDLSDKNFRPCPCGYQICQFCFNSLKTTYEKSTCPNCRRPYDEKTIQYKIPTAEEFKLDQLNKNKKQAAAKRKETEKREVENSSRRNLAGVRVKQQNLVYVIGLIPSLKDEQALLQTLRGPEYFGQYGEIDKIVVSKAKPGAPNQGIGVYVTYARKEDAALCINTVDGSLNGDRVLRAQFGTTKYCSAYLRGETCTNKNCSFLHETGEDGQHTSLQNEPHGARISARPILPAPTASIHPPARPLSATQTVVSQSMARQGSAEDEDSRKNSHDGSALPSTASWANANANVVRTGRASQANSRATPSPQITHASLAANKTEDATTAEPFVSQPSTATIPAKVTPKPEQSTSKPNPEPLDPAQQIFDHVKRVMSRDYRFIYDDSCLSPEVRAEVEDMPCFIDPYGGAKRRAMRNKEEAERARLEADAKDKLEAQATMAAEETLEEDNIVAGSLALGGEPEDDPRSSSARGAIGRPSQPLNDQFSSMNLNPRSLTPQQRQQLGLLNTGTTQPAPGLGQPSTQNTAFEMSDFERRGPQYSQAQYEQISNHQRHGSRYFNNDSKAGTGSRFQGQQGFYSSGVQGPPPGLPTAGTPPVSGGGMFAHGQNFTAPGFGPSKDINAEVYSRNRSGTNQGHEMAKRGGVEHLADPSIASARVHQSNTTGQGLFGGNQVDVTDFPPLPITIPIAPLHSRVSSMQSYQSSIPRSSTPRVPPGFEHTHAHPAPSKQEDVPPTTQAPAQRSTTTNSVPVTPAVPLLPIGPRTTTPKPKAVTSTREDVEKAKAVEKQSPLPVQITNEANEISLGSPKPKPSRSKTTAEKTDPVKDDEVENKDEKTAKITGKANNKDGSTEKEDEANEKKDNLPTSARTDVIKTKKGSVVKPSKIELPTKASPVTYTQVEPLRNTETPLDHMATPILDAAVLGTPGAISQPVTPGPATPTEPPKASVRPRVLRLTTGQQPKHNEHVPASATTERSSVPATMSAKKGSRRPSVSSILPSRPSTPAMSERPSHDAASRASSPPPSIIGSAPERTKTKAQQKKERKEKSKQIPEPNEVAIAVNAPIVEDVAPVIARQKKQKRRVESSTIASTDEISSPKQIKETKTVEADDKKAPSEPDAIPTAKQLETVTAVSAAKKQNKAPPQVTKSSTPVPETSKDEVAPKSEEIKPAYSVRDLLTDAAKIAGPSPDTAAVHAAVQKLLQEHVSSMPKIISSLLQSGDLNKEHAWLNPPSFNSPAYKLPPDSRRGQDYLDGNAYSANDAFGYIYLPMKEKQALKDGNAVSVADAGERKDDLLKRCLVTPNGWVLRHLSAEESEKGLELEERRQTYAEDFGEVGTMSGLGVLEPDDFTNLGGGMERLARQGERHGVVWIMGEDGQMVEDDEFEPFDDEEGAVDGMQASDDDLEGFDYSGVDEDIDDEAFAGDDRLDMPGAWEHPPRLPLRGNGAGSRLHSLPGLGPHSRTNVLGLLSQGPSSIGERLQQGSLAIAGSSTGSAAASLATAPPTIPATRNESVNLRLLEPDTLQKRVQESQKALELARKEMEKMEKMANRKAKDINRWRDGIVGSLISAGGKG